MDPKGVKTFELSNIREGGTLLTDQLGESKNEGCPYRVSVARQAAANR